MGAPKLVTLVCVEPGIPYIKGDVFSVEKDVAAKLLDRDYKGDLKVRKFDPKKDQELLDQQRGKTEDGEVVEPQTNDEPSDEE